MCKDQKSPKNDLDEDAIAQMTDNIIHTKGNFSPGTVHGDFKITKTIINQQVVKQKKQWRDLPVLLYYVPSDSTSSRSTFIRDLVIGLDKAFAGTKYMKFNGILSVQSIPKSKVLVYMLYCPHPEFCEMVRQRVCDRTQEIFSLKKRKIDPIEREGEKNILWEKMKKEAMEFDKNWRVIYQNIFFSPQWVPLEFVYDSAMKLITFQSIQKFSLNPADYVDGIKTTSELLHYIASIPQIPIAFIDGFGWFKENYPLMKLFINILDNEIVEFDNIRINIDDYEEWDYINPKVDEEIRYYENRKNLK